MLDACQLGPYCLVERLSVGAVAEVWRAAHAQTGAPVAVKAVRPACAGDAQAWALFEREADTLARLAHPHIVPLLDRGEQHGVPFFAMPLIAETLADALAAGPLPAPRVARIITQLAAALDHVHAAGLIHGDIKPANVLLDAGDWVLLADFGTPSGGGVGTPGYQAPERAAGRGDRRADVFGLGALAYALLTGAPPPATGPWLWHRRPTLRSVRHANPDLSPDVDRALAMALDPRPDGRQHTARELAEAIGSALEKTAMPLPPQPPTRYLPRRQPLWQQAGLVMIGALVVGLLALGLRYEGDDSPSATAPAGPMPQPAAASPAAPPAPAAPSRPVTTHAASSASTALVEDLGLWIFNQPQPSLPPPASVNQILIAHGDVTRTNTCHIRVFTAGEKVELLSAGTFGILRVTGTPEQRQRELDRIAADLNSSRSCPFLATSFSTPSAPAGAQPCRLSQSAFSGTEGDVTPHRITAGDPTAVMHLDYYPAHDVLSVSYIVPPRSPETWFGFGIAWRGDANTCAGFDFVADATRYAGERQSAGHSGLVVDLRSGSPVVAANVGQLSPAEVDRLLTRHRASQAREATIAPAERLAYYETGRDKTQTWNLRLPAGTTLVYGGYAVDGFSGGIYGAIAGPADITLTIRDGFAVLVPEERGREEYCFRIEQARQHAWAMGTQRPLSKWASCTGVSHRTWRIA